jgi:hypothetical protein
VDAARRAQGQEDRTVTELLDEKMEQAIDFFAHAADHPRRGMDEALYAHLKAMAAGIQENRRVLDYVQTQLDEIHHRLSSH